MAVDPAIADFSEALRMAPKDYDVLVARAKAYTMKQYLRRTMDDLNRAIEIDPMKASAYGFRLRTTSKPERSAAGSRVA
jgi:hypothetical protein